MSRVSILSVSGFRGIVGNGFDPLLAVEYCAAYASTCGEGAILVGHDGRTSAPVFVPAILSAVAATGHDALCLGAVATPTIGRLARTSGAAGAIQLTASHNPPEYSGIKCFDPAGIVLSPEAGGRVVSTLSAHEISWVDWTRLGSISDWPDPDRDHFEALLKTVNLERIQRRRFRVLLDSNHGAGGRLGLALLQAMGCEVLLLGGNPDGRYEHPPEPTLDNLAGLSTRVAVSGVDVAFAQDPDADRLAILDETGRYIGEELTLALAVGHRLTQAQGSVVANLSTSRLIDFVSASYGVKPLRTPVGEYHVASKMRDVGALIGGEGNGGVIDPRVGFVRDSFAGMALILELMATREEPLSHTVNELPRLAMVKSKCVLKGPLTGLEFERVEHALGADSVDRRDGLRLDWSDRWVQVRPSNTEPIVRVIAEAEEESAAIQLIQQVEAALRSTSSSTRT
jgi:phosphomannomutase